jgi:hypothetical protein
MNKTKVLRWITLTTPVLVLLAAFASGGISSAAPNAPIKLVEAPRGIVLYGLTEGTYADAVDVFNKLVTLRNDHGIRASGDWGTFVFLSPPDTNPDRLLIEVRIPVQEKALSLSGRVAEVAHVYGLGTAGVKRVSQGSEIRIIKPIGAQNPEPFYTKAYSFIQANELAVSGPPSMTFAKSEEIPAECESAELAATLAIPVAKDAALADLRERVRRGQQ